MPSKSKLANIFIKLIDMSFNEINTAYRTWNKYLIWKQILRDTEINKVTDRSIKQTIESLAGQ